MNVHLQAFIITPLIFEGKTKIKKEVKTAKRKRPWRF